MSTGMIVTFAAGLAIGVVGGRVLPVIAAAEGPTTNAPPTANQPPMVQLPSSGKVFTVLVGGGDVVMLHCQEKQDKK